MLNEDRWPADVVEPTATTPAQLAGVDPDTSAPELPAATTTRAPRPTASVIAVCIVASQAPDPPSERLRILAGVALTGTPGTLPPAAQRMAAAMSLVQPPHLPSTRTGWTFVSHAMPAMPTPLLPRAAMVPATCVPCQLELPTWQPAK